MSCPSCDYSNVEELFYEDPRFVYKGGGFPCEQCGKPCCEECRYKKYEIDDYDGNVRLFCRYTCYVEWKKINML